MVTKPGLVVICKILYYSNLIPSDGSVLLVTGNLNNHINQTTFTNICLVSLCLPNRLHRSNISTCIILLLLKKRLVTLIPKASCTVSFLPVLRNQAKFVHVSPLLSKR